LLLFWLEVDWIWNSGEPTDEEPRRSDWGEREKENKTVKKIYYLKKMKSGIEIIVRIFLKKLVIKIKIYTF
jgi:hypothetical protein